MKMRISVLFLAAIGAASALASALIVGCQEQPGRPPATKSGSGKSYSLKGKVVSFDRTKATITLDHEDIPGLMKAMTMDFQVSDGTIFDKIKAGDLVEGKVAVDGGTYSITILDKR